jgi:hypothetical protein
LPNFNSGLPSICDFFLGGRATGIGPGQTGIQVHWTADSWFMGLNEQCEYTAVDLLREAICNVLRPEILLRNAQLFNLTATFSGISASTQTASLRVGSSAHGTAICGDDPQEFTLIVNFTLPEGGELVASRCTARPESIPDHDYNVGTPTCVIDDSFFRRGHMSMPARRRCCPATDSHPGIRFVIVANKAGQVGVIDTPGTVNVLCNQ